MTGRWTRFLGSGVKLDMGKAIIEELQELLVG
jgi:hypothetical protein